MNSIEKTRKRALITAGSSAMVILIGWCDFSEVERSCSAASMIGPIVSSPRPCW